MVDVTRNKTTHFVIRDSLFFVYCELGENPRETSFFKGQPLSHTPRQTEQEILFLIVE